MGSRNIAILKRLHKCQKHDLHKKALSWREDSVTITQVQGCCVFIRLCLGRLRPFATKLPAPSSQFTKCLLVIITCHAFKPTRLKSERQWSWRRYVTLASLPTSIDCLRHAFDCSSRSLAITYALTVAQDIPNGLLSATALSFALTVPVDTAVWECT